MNFILALASICPVVLNKAKFQARHSLRASNEMITDAEATKKVLDISIHGKHLNGFVQQIGAVPFGYLMVSEIQVKYLYSFSSP
jgi:hypothetical protein